MVFQRRYDFRTESGMVEAFKAVVRPKDVKQDRDVVSAIHESEQKVTALRVRRIYQIG